MAARVLDRVRTGAWATPTLAAEIDRARLEGPDRALATQLVYGVLKRRRRLDHALAAYAPRGITKLDPRVLDLLRLGAHQLLFMRVPAHAAVDETIASIKKLRGQTMAGFANALLRRLGREGEPPPPPGNPERLGVIESAPDWLVTAALARFAPDEAAELLAAFNRPSPLWLRAHTPRASRAAVIERLSAERPDATITASERSPHAIRVEAGGDLARSGVFTEGWVAIQDLGAQLVVDLLAPRPGERLLDACAGVGGKTGHVAALAPGGSIDACDASERKLELCRDQLHRLGVAGAVRVLQGDTAALAADGGPLGRYDGVLLDAPCDGLGVLRRHPEAKWREPVDPAPLVALQARLLAAVARRVVPGGRLVYAVCTFVDVEGPQQVQGFLAAHPEFTLEEELRTWPHRDDADAFYAARLRRRE